MSAADAFLAGIGVSVALALAAVGILRRSLATVLAELCGGRRRGAFWVELFSLAMVLGSAIASSLPDRILLVRSPSTGDLAMGVIVQVLLGLVGIVAGLATVGVFLVLWLRRLEQLLAERGVHSKPGGSSP